MQHGYSNKTNKGLSSGIKLLVSIFRLVWKKKHFDIFLPKNTAWWPWPELKPGQLDFECSALTIWPPCLLHIHSQKLACVAGVILRASAFLLVAKAVNARGEAMRGLVKSRVEFTHGFAAHEFPRGQSPRGNMAALPPLRSPAHASRQLCRLPRSGLTLLVWLFLGNDGQNKLIYSPVSVNLHPTPGKHGA